MPVLQSRRCRIDGESSEAPSFTFRGGKVFNYRVNIGLLKIPLFYSDITLQILMYSCNIWSSFIISYYVFMSRIVRERREVCGRDYRILREGVRRRVRGRGRHRWRGERNQQNFHYKALLRMMMY